MSDSVDLSVVIPTFNRRSRLDKTLQVLARQDTANAKFEVVAVDNGSSDGTFDFLKGAVGNLPYDLVVLQDPRPGVSNPKNTGVEAAKGDIILFIGDDTEPARFDLIERHLELHQESPENVMLVGRIEWNPDQPVTDFMRWLDSGGPQFHYHEIEAGPVDPGRYLYGSHSSLKKSFFEREGGFDSRFTGLYEDAELGARLGRAGGTLFYHPELLLLHDHPTTLEQSLRRMQRAGHSAYLYNKLHPDHPHPAVQEPNGLRSQLLLYGEPIIRFVPGKKALWARHLSQYVKGYREAVSADPQTKRT